MKYDNYNVTFSEVPDHISLYITITNCPIRCPNCNSKHLWNDIGTTLDWSSLSTIIEHNRGITCICLGGGDSEPNEINKLAKYIKDNTDLKVCWYSGQDTISSNIDIANFDYIKIGHFNGIPLNEKDTNQKMYQINHFPKGKFELVDITYKFNKNES